MNDTKALLKPEVITDTVNLLLVDDRKENLISLQSVLDSPGRNIFTALSGEEALKIALENDIAVMLLDVQMPGMDGFEVARLLRKNSKTKDISIVFVTAISKEERFVMQGYEEGAVDYLHKPLDINIVKAKVSVFEKLYMQRIQLSGANEKLQQLNNQLNEFVYVVSHDLKAPLRGISSLASFLMDEIPSPSVEVKEMIAMMISRTDRMQKLIEGILHYSRMSNSIAEKEPVEIKELITSIIDLLGENDVRFTITGDVKPFNAERTKLHEVFQNLIANAIKYNDKEKKEVIIQLEEYPEYCIFSVQDNGMGIKQQMHQKIFGLFQTLHSKDESDSTGIGLTIVKKLVEKQGGQIFLKSEPGKGSTFSFKWMK